MESYRACGKFPGMQTVRVFYLSWTAGHFSGHLKKGKASKLNDKCELESLRNNSAYLDELSWTLVVVRETFALHQPSGFEEINMGVGTWLK